MRAAWPFRLSVDEGRALELKAEADALAQRAQYGWGQTIDFGPFRMDGLLGEQYLEIAALWDQWGWWPESFRGLSAVDIGCFTGGTAMLMAGRGAERVLAVDEVPAHLAQCEFVARVFGAEAVECRRASLYGLPSALGADKFDLIVVSGVLYHLSDMLVGLLAVRELLRDGGVLLLESHAVECFEHSYANFGRFYGGEWWQPTALCIQDLCDYMGLGRPEIRFYKPDRCLARAVRAPDSEIRFRRGLNWPFADLGDATPRTIDPRIMAPAVCRH